MNFSKKAAYIMTFIPNKTQHPRKPSTAKPLQVRSVKELIRLSLPYQKQMILAGLCIILINAAQLLKPYLLKLVIDDFLIKRTAAHGLYSLNTLGLFYLLVAGGSALLAYTQVNLVNRSGQEIIKNLRIRVFRTIQLLPLSYLDRTASGRLITRATNDIAEIGDFYTDASINMMKDLFLLVGVIYTMLTLNLQLALLSFVVIPVMVFLVVVIKHKIRANFFAMKHFIGRINGFMAESIAGMKVIQIFRAEREKEAEFLKLNQEYFQTTLIQVRLNSILKPTADLLQNLTVAGLLWYGMGKIAGHTLEIGLLYAFTTYIKQFFRPISELADKYNSIQSAFVSTERIFDLLGQTEIMEDLETGRRIDRITGLIEFRHVWFAYQNEDWVLKDVSFKITPGETVAFVGATGAGKSTIISLVNGFYRIQKGQILIDGHNIAQLNLRDLRRNIAVVLQEAFLFSGTIRANVTLNDPLPPEEVERALELSCAASFVRDLPQGSEAEVLERGNTLSAGQRQLLAFARAIAHNPAVLVLDEATANIDTHTEKLIQTAIENISRGRTTLIIAHRLSTIRQADQIIVMRHGKIVETGKHQELLRLEDGLYRQMVEFIGDI
jgi:ATP-binding cassette subfamily B multidrug efflux pump